MALSPARSLPWSFRQDSKVIPMEGPLFQAGASGLVGMRGADTDETLGVLANRIVAWCPRLILLLCPCRCPADLNGRGLSAPGSRRGRFALSRWYTLTGMLWAGATSARLLPLRAARRRNLSAKEAALGREGQVIISFKGAHFEKEIIFPHGRWVLRDVPRVGGIQGKPAQSTGPGGGTW